MKKIRTLIVDDEPLARRGIRRLLSSDADIEIVGECGDGLAAIEAMKEKRPDLLLLDVQIPEKNGFEVLESLNGDRMPAVIFITAYDHYAIRAFDVHALDYVLKPFEKERFEASLGRAKEDLQQHTPEELKSRMLSLIRAVRNEQQYAERLLVKTGGRVMFLRSEEIDWIEAQGNYLRLHKGQDSYLIRQTMSEMEARLNPSRFLRIHRSSIVNIERIKELHPLFHGDYNVVLQNGIRLTLSRNYRHKVPPYLGSSL
jgi:two-component system, LytTR family, response regulator